MNEREIGELRRRLRPDRSGITHVLGCYVNENREVVARFDQSLAMMTQEEGETLLGVLRRTLSGGVGRNLRDITFDTRQVLEGEEHKLLMELRSTALQDDALVAAFFERVIGSVDVEGNYLILLAHDVYDVPGRGGDGEAQEDGSTSVFSYLLCAVCPVKQTRPALSYYVRENEFHNREMDYLVSPPELGFLFPAFDGRAANLYNALCYTRDTARDHAAFIEAVFRKEPPMPAAVQRETFQGLLGGVLEEECSLEVVQAVQERLGGLAEEQKHIDREELPALSKRTVRRALEDCGVSPARVAAFDRSYDEALADSTDLTPKNLVDARKLELTAGEVSVQLAAGRGELVQTRVINGVPYILIRAEEGVLVNGVPISVGR